MISTEEFEQPKFYTKEEALSSIKSGSSWKFIKDSPKLEDVVMQINKYLDTLVDDDVLVRLDSVLVQVANAS